MAKAITFNNYTDEDFVHKYDGDPWTFKAGESMKVQEGIALLMAKHLADRELRKNKLPFDHASRAEIMSKILIADDAIEAVSEEKLEAEIMNEKFVCEVCGKEAKSKAGLTAHMRSHKKEEAEDEEFEGLNE